MAIEGPLRELGIHDVFQILDLSRKTGILRVSSEARHDEGTVAFDRGRVVLATIRSNAMPIEAALLAAGRVSNEDIQYAREQRTLRPGIELADLLVEIGAVTQKELERHLRQQVESVVFELMSWSEGFFSFEERARDEMPSGIRISVSTESLLMEGARRIDEWSRIADTIPHAAIVPELAPVDAEREGSQLDLLPHEWQVLTMIDGVRDLRTIASALARNEFEVAKIAYGLVRTGVVVVRLPAAATRTAQESGEALARIAAARAHTDAGRYDAALGELRRAVRQDPDAPELHRALGYAAARIGDLRLARASWNQYLDLSNGATGTASVRNALAALETFFSIVDTEIDASSD
jgi:hypothetical protein